MTRRQVFYAGFATIWLASCSTQMPPAPPLPPAVPPSPIYKTSFICYGDITPVQAVVCHDPQLAALDIQMVSAFRRHAGADSLFQRDELLAMQRAWLLALPRSCSVVTLNGPATMPDPAVVSCLAESYSKRIVALNTWRVVQSAPLAASGNAGIAHYVQYKILDAKQPALCDLIKGESSNVLSPDGSIDPARLVDGQEIAGTHGAATAADPWGSSFIVDSYSSGLYGGYQMRARSLQLSDGTKLIGPNTLGGYVVSLQNNGGRFSTSGSQTNDYGALDLFSLHGQILALVTDTIGYDTPVPPGAAATAALFSIGPHGADRACLFETYLNPPQGGSFGEQPSLTPFLALLDEIHGNAPIDLASTDRQDTTHLSDEARWTMLNMPLVALEQAKTGGWTGWLRFRHDQALDTLFAWSQKSSENRAAFARLFNLLRPAALDLNRIYLQEQGLPATDAKQATALAMMELVYGATTYIAPDLVSDASDPTAYRNYKPRYPILATPQS